MRHFDWAARGRLLLDSIGRVWLPPRCLVCGAHGQAGIDLCGTCLAMLPALATPIDGRLACVRCGDLSVAAPITRPSAVADRHGNAKTGAMAGGTSSVFTDAPTPVCARCSTHRSIFRHHVTPLRYDYPLDRLIRSLKHEGDRRVARVLGELLAAEALRVHAPGALLPDCLLPVPLHPSRAARRGFNHAADLAYWAGCRTGVPMFAGHAARVLDTGSLAELSRAERQLRIRGAFRVSGRLAGLDVALVDDVTTSGATASELARECHDSGATSVSLWAVARTVASGSVMVEGPRGSSTSNLRSTVGS